MAAADAGEDVQEDVDPLAGDVRADVQELGRAAGLGRAEQAGGGGVVLGAGVGGALGVDGEVDDAEPLRGQEAVAEDRRRGWPRCRRPRRRPCCRPVEGAAGQGAEPARAGLGGRVEQAAEGVEVVAGDDRPARRQGVDELGVAVIDEVEQVVAARGGRCRGGAAG